jgi:translin
LSNNQHQLRKLTEQAHTLLTSKHEAREQALRLSRSINQLSSISIRHVHRGEYQETIRLIDEIKVLLSKTKDIAIAHQEIYYAGFVQDAHKEYAEASLTLAFITGSDIPSPEDLGISYAPYLNGLGEVIGEMRRYILDRLRLGDTSRSEEILDLMDEIHTELFSLDFPEAITGGLRRTTDAMRGLIERTRGDLTTALRQQALEQNLGRLLERTPPEGLDEDNV